MKKRILFLGIGLVLLTTQLLSQTQKGKFIVGGSTEMSYSSVKTTLKYDGQTIVESDENQNSFNFKPGFGYFVADNIAFTATLEISSESQGDAKANSLIFSPGIRYYVGTSNVRPLFLAELGIGSRTETLIEGELEDAKFGLFGFGLGAGAAFFITPAVSFDALLGYSSMTATYNDDNKLKLKLGGVVFQAGFSIYF